MRHCSSAVIFSNAVSCGTTVTSCRLIANNIDNSDSHGMRIQAHAFCHLLTGRTSNKKFVALYTFTYAKYRNSRSPSTQASSVIKICCVHIAILCTYMSKCPQLSAASSKLGYGTLLARTPSLPSSPSTQFFTG